MSCRYFSTVCPSTVSQMRCCFGRRDMISDVCGRRKNIPTRLALASFHISYCFLHLLFCQLDGQVAVGFTQQPRTPQRLVLITNHAVLANWQKDHRWTTPRQSQTAETRKSFCSMLAAPVLVVAFYDGASSWQCANRHADLMLPEFHKSGMYEQHYPVCPTSPIDSDKVPIAP